MKVSESLSLGTIPTFHSTGSFEKHTIVISKPHVFSVSLSYINLHFPFSLQTGVLKRSLKPRSQIWKPQSWQVPYPLLPAPTPASREGASGAPLPSALPIGTDEHPRASLEGRQPLCIRSQSRTVTLPTSRKNTFQSACPCRRGQSSVAHGVCVWPPQGASAEGLTAPFSRRAQGRSTTRPC